MLKVLSLIVIFLAEALTIYAEIYGAKITMENNFSNIAYLILAVVIGSLFLLAGYCLGIKAYGDIWTVCAVSITSILISEPIIAYTLFGDLPHRGALVGFVLGSLGLLATLFL